MKYNVTLLGGAPLHLFLNMSQAAHLDGIFVMLKLNIWTPRWTFQPITEFWGFFKSCQLKLLYIIHLKLFLYSYSLNSCTYFDVAGKNSNFQQNILIGFW